MKKLALLALISTIALADESVVQDDYCSQLHEAATLTMQYRQEGIAMIKLYQATEHEMIRAIIKDAYKQPRYTLEEYQQNAVIDFANDIYLQCVEAMEGAE